MWKSNSTFAAGHGNNREVQPLHHRELHYFESEAAESGEHANLGLIFVILFGITLAILICSYISFIRCPNIYKDALAKAHGGHEKPEKEEHKAPQNEKATH
jgi:hypothetical protein